MPEQLVVLMAIVGIVIVGLAFTSIKLLKDIGQFIAFGLLAFLVVLLLNRALPSGTTTATYPASPASPYSPGTYPPGTYPPGTYPTPYTAQPSSPTNPAIPNSSTSGSFNVDSALNGFSGFVKTAFDRIDEFVYGNPYAVDQPTRSLQPDTAQPNTASQQPTVTADQPIEPGYQIRPDGVPSRVSSPVDSAAPVTRPATANTSSRPVSAWW
jgi:hypothetical protein